jgi:hypothetical protein
MLSPPSFATMQTNYGNDTKQNLVDNMQIDLSNEVIRKINK